MLEPQVTRSALLPAVHPGLSVRECGAAGCYPPLCLPRSLPLWVRPSQFICANVGPQGLLVVGLPAPLVPHCASLGPATATGHWSPLHPGARLPLSYWSGWMFIFCFLGIGLPCHSIFCQFWLCEEAQCVYLCSHLGSPVSYLFFKRGEEKHQCVVASRTPPTGDLACKWGMCPDWELKWWPLGLQAGTQATEPHQPGLFYILISTKYMVLPTNSFSGFVREKEAYRLPLYFILFV